MSALRATACADAGDGFEWFEIQVWTKREGWHRPAYLERVFVTERAARAEAETMDVTGALGGTVRIVQFTARAEMTELVGFSR